MGFLDKLFGKKEEPHYDSTDIRVQDLDVGFVFEYDMQTWEVKALYEYDWGENFFSREFKINNGSETLFLSMEEDDVLSLSLSKKIKLISLGKDLHSKLMESGKAPASLEYDGSTFYLEEESPGYFRDVSSPEDSWEEFIAWDYEDEKGERILTIEQYDEREFEASVGKVIKEFEISHILPASE